MRTQTVTPRDILCDVLRGVVESLPDSGIRLVQTRPMLRLGTPGFPAEIAFNGSKFNRLGDKIEYQLVASVSAKGLKAWRLAQPHLVARERDNASGWLATKAFMDPKRPDDFYSWELGDENAVLVGRMARVVEGQVVPWLRACEDPANFPKLGLILPFALNFIELALMEGRRELANSLAEHAITTMLAQRKIEADKRGLALAPLPNVDMPLPELLRWSDEVRNLKGLIEMHNLDVEWPR